MSSVEYYLGLLDDRERIRRFGESIAATVKPGDVVLEVGCGLGTYAIAAANAGAATVIAVDLNPIAIAMARELGAEKAGVTLVEGRVESLTLENPASVVIFEDFGSFAHTRGLRTLFDAVHRLASPAARYVPGRVRLRTALTDVPVAVTADALPFSPEAIEMLKRRSGNSPYWRTLPPGCVAGPAVEVGVLDLARPVPKRSVYSGSLKAARPAAVSGVVAWMALDLPGTVEIDNAPSRPNASWPAIVFPFVEPLSMNAGEAAEVVIEAVEFAGAILWKWKLGPREGTSVNAMPAGLLLRGSADWKPPASDPARIAALELMNGTRSVSEIARALAGRFPDRFRGEREAVDWLFGEIERGGGVS
jgi:SAM-dependent methyltransferase